jgi:hypothetical protein
VVDRPLNSGVELHQIESITYTLTERPEFVVHGLDLNGVKRDKSCLSRTLVAHIFDTVDGCFLFINDDSIDISAKDDGYCCFILSFRGFAEINESASNA